MGITGITGLRFYLTWLRDGFNSTLCSAKAQRVGGYLSFAMKAFPYLEGLLYLPEYNTSKGVGNMDTDSPDPKRQSLIVRLTAKRAGSLIKSRQGSDPHVRIFFACSYPPIRAY
jgi:hypothetical protein